MITCLEDVVKRDPRFAYEAYEFTFLALEHTQKLLGRAPRKESEAAGATAEGESAHHVSGPELLRGVRDLARREFGLMARTVFKLWGVNCTGDFGDIVFNLIEAGLMSKTERDERGDFRDVFDLDDALADGYVIPVGEPE